MKSCNQCNKEMEGNVYVSAVLGFGNKELTYCKNPECPNFSLLQVPFEEIEH